MHETHGFNWLNFVPGLDVHHYGHVALAMTMTILVLVFGAIARVQLQGSFSREDQGLIPDAKLTVRNFFEILLERLYGLAEQVMGEKTAAKYFPITAAIFLFVFTNNFIGLIPGFLPPTDNINTTFAIGVFVFLYYNYVGIRENGFGYLKHFVGPIWWLAPLLLVVELASHLFRPLSLAFRLRGNIMGDHLVLSISQNIEYVKYIFPVIFYGMGLFVSLVQAFVFCLMTMVYISLSASHDH